MKSSTRLSLFLLCTTLFSGSGFAMAPGAQKLTLLVVPARYSVLQVMFDVLDRRNAVLVSYQGDATTAEPILHAWTGTEWVFVSLADYETANFVQTAPRQAVLVGDENTLPQTLVSRTAWCPLVMNIPEVDSASLVNSLGNLFKFRSSDWSWFATRYNLTLDDLNAERRKTSWYDRPYVETSYPYQSAPTEEPVEILYSDSAETTTSGDAEVSDVPPATEPGPEDVPPEPPPATVVIEPPSAETSEAETTDIIK